MTAGVCFNLFALVIMIFAPESPIFLLKKGQIIEGIQVLKKASMLNAGGQLFK